MADIITTIMTYLPLIVSGLYLAEKAFKVYAKFTVSTKDDEIAATIDGYLTQALDVLGLQVDADGNVSKK